MSYLGCQSQLFASSSIPPLNAIGLGTFLYVLFFEIAPHEFLGNSEKPNKFFKSLVLVAGVGFTESFVHFSIFSFLTKFFKILKLSVFFG